MAQKFLQHIDLNGLELQNAVLQPLGTAPGSPSVGRMFFNSTDGKPYWYDGSKYITFPLLIDVTTLQGYFTNGKANDALKLGGVALDGLFTALSTSTTNAVSITVGGVSKNITVADLKTSLGLKGLAYKDTIDWNVITTGKPTTIGGYGITDAYTKTEVGTLLKGYLPLTGGDIKGNLSVAGTFKIGKATFTWDETNGVLIVDKPFASTGAISTKGIGSSSGGGGSVDLTKVVSNILPTKASTYSVGSSSLPWKSVYADELYAGGLNVGSAISSLQTTVGQHGSNIQGLLTAVNNIQTNYAERSYVDSAVDEVYRRLLGEDDTTEAVDSIKEVLALVDSIKKENLVFKYTETITGNGTNTSFTIDHNLGTKDVVVFVYEVSSPYQQVYVDVKMANTEYLTVEFAKAPKTTDKYKVVVMA